MTPRPSSKRVLVVDDDDDIREVIGELLDDVGYEVILARDGRQALAMLTKEPLPSAIVLDMMMPGMDGATFRAKQLADERLAAIPVVAISAFGKPRLPGVRETLAKPFDMSALREAIERACGNEVR
jgi:CheY-like chemotaxis protein